MIVLLAILLFWVCEPEQQEKKKMQEYEVLQMVLEADREWKTDPMRFMTQNEKRELYGLPPIESKKDGK